MACGGAAVFKVLQFILSVTCLVYKRYTDNEALRVFYHLQKLSREWPLLNNITWDENGALLADVTFGGFALISLGLLVGQLAGGELAAARRTVCFFLVLGCVLFLAVGGLCLAAVDQVPHHLVDNAVVLGVLSVVTGLLFLLDLAFTGNTVKATGASSAASKGEKSAKAVASSPQAVVPQGKSDSGTKVEDSKPSKYFGNGVLKELRSSLKRKKTAEDPDQRVEISDKSDRNVEFEQDKESRAESELTQRSDDDRQYGRRRMENRGFPARTASDDSGRFSGDRFRNDFVDAERDRRFDRDVDRPGSRNVSVLEGAYDGRRSRRASMMEVELDEHYLGPQEYRVERRVRDELRIQDHRVTSSRKDINDDDLTNDTAQLPSVSFLLSERGRKVLPSLSSSPVERLEQVTRAKPRYYYNSRDPASGSSAPPSPRPGRVRSVAAHWDADPPPAFPTTLGERLQQWARARPARAPSPAALHYPPA